MTTFIRRGALVLMITLGVSACTPVEMESWLVGHDFEPPEDEATLQEYADLATTYWESVFAGIPPAVAAPTSPPAPAPAPAPAAPAGQVGWPWSALVNCEASGNWATNTGNGYYGGLQFAHSTWISYGGQSYAPYAHQATAAQQIDIAQRIVSSHGGSYRAWPACRSSLGLP